MASPVVPPAIESLIQRLKASEKRQLEALVRTRDELEAVHKSAGLAYQRPVSM